jgi:hypothetical protein
MAVNVTAPTAPTAPGGARGPAAGTLPPEPASGAATADAAPAARPEPSWTRVLATTVRLWGLRSATAIRPGEAGRPGQDGSLRSPGPPGRPSARRWRLAALAAAAAGVAVGALAVTGVFAGTPAPAGRVSAAGNPPAGTTASPGASAQAGAAVQAAAAAWVADQVSSDAIVVCDPAMCAALQAHGVPASRLMPLRSGSASVPGAIVVLTASDGSGAAGRYAPALIASFGSGASRIEIRASEPGGAAGYEAALRADRAARMSAGAQLLRNPRIRFSAQDAAQLQAGEVDARVLATLAALSSQHSFDVAGFGDTSPGVALLFREVTITAGRGRGAAAELAAALALVKAQDEPFLPAGASVVRLAAGQLALRIEFAAPSPLGLLTSVLDVDRSPGEPARTAIAGPFPAAPAVIT